MFLKLSDEQILLTRKQRFPDPSCYSIKNAIFKISGTDTLAEIDILLKDLLEKPKVFKNELQKNYIKFKIFEINSEQMKNELSTTTLITEIEEIIKKYGSNSIDLFACTDFIGSKIDASEHIIENGNITLKYKVNMVFPSANMKYLSIGMIFYFNLKDYLIENKISEKHVVRGALSNSLKIIDLFDGNGKSVNMDVVQDLRVVNKVFKNTDLLNNLTDRLNVEQKVLKGINQPKKIINNSQFFSHLYNSRDVNGNLNMLFFMDYRKIVENYSIFSQIIKNSTFQSEVYKKCKISSLKIVRRQVENSGKKNIIIKRQPYEFIISTSQNKREDLVQLFSVETSTAAIREIDISKFKTIEVIDKTVYKTKKPLYQYGLEMSVNDGFYAFLKDLKEQLSFNVKIFKDYLQETSKIIKTGNQLSQKNLKKEMDIGFYDPILNAFSRRFCEEIFPILYEKEIIKSISFLASSMELFGILKNVEKSDFISSLVSLASPSSATNETINYFIRVYEKFISQIEHSIKDVSNTSFSLEYWFEKQTIDSKENPGVGYGFFDKKTDGISKITNLDFEAKIESDSLEYIQKNSTVTDKEEYKYSSVSPSFINTIGKKVSLKDIKTMSNDIFKNLELEIKRYNSLGDAQPEPFLDDDLKIKDSDKTISNLKTEKLMNRFSFMTNNRTLQISDQKKLKLKGNENIEKINTSLDPQLLFLGMLKNTSKKITFNNVTTANLSNRNGIIAEKQKKYRQDIPLQIYSLLKKNDTLFSEAGIKYLTDLEYNSKFLLLYNTVHQIEIFKDTNIVKDEKWKLLTKKEYNDLPQNSKTLCRLKIFQDVNSDITGFQEIKLPIYDSYFILEKNVSQQEINKKIDFLRNTFEYSVIKNATNILLNTLPKVSEIAPIPKPKIPTTIPPIRLPSIPGRIPTTPSTTIPVLRTTTLPPVIVPRLGIGEIPATSVPLVRTTGILSGVATDLINVPVVGTSRLSPVVQPSLNEIKIPDKLPQALEANIAANFSQVALPVPAPVVTTRVASALTASVVSAGLSGFLSGAPPAITSSTAPRVTTVLTSSLGSGVLSGILSSTPSSISPSQAPRITLATTPSAAPPSSQRVTQTATPSAEVGLRPSLEASNRLNNLLNSATIASQQQAPSNLEKDKKPLDKIIKDNKLSALQKAPVIKK